MPRSNRRIIGSTKEWRSIGPVPGKLFLPSPKHRGWDVFCSFIWHQGYHHLYLFVAVCLCVRGTQQWKKKRTLSNPERFGKINRDARVLRDVQCVMCSLCIFFSGCSSHYLFPHACPSLFPYVSLLLLWLNIFFSNI